MIIMEKKGISPRAMVRVQQYQIQIMMWEKLDQMELGSDKISASSSQDIVSPQSQIQTNPEDSQFFSSQSSGTDAIRYKNLSTKQQKLVKSLEALIITDPTTKKAIMTMTYSRPNIFWMTYFTHHPLFAIFCSKCVHYSRKTMILNFFTSFNYILAVTMFLGMGIDKGGFTSYQNFILNAIISLFLVTILCFVIKKLQKDETKYGMSICNLKSSPIGQEDTKKKEGDEGPKQISVIHPANRSRNVSNIEGGDSVPDERPIENPKPIARPLERDSSMRRNGPRMGSGKRTMNPMTIPSEDPTTPTSATTSLLGGSPQLIPRVEENSFRRTVGGLVAILIGYIIMILLIPLSAVIVYSVTSRVGKDGNWPFGLWFIFQMIYELTLGKIPTCAIQYLLFKMYMDGRNQDKGFKAWYSKKKWFLNSDLIELTKMSDDVHLPSKSQRLQ